MAKHRISIRLPEALHELLLAEVETLKEELPQGQPSKTWLAQRYVIERLEALHRGEEQGEATERLEAELADLRDQVQSLRTDIGRTLRVLLGVLIADGEERKKAADALDAQFPRNSGA